MASRPHTIELAPDAFDLVSREAERRGVSPDQVVEEIIERAPLVEAKMREWATAGETLHAPALMPYEAANALVEGGRGGGLGPHVVAEIWATISAVPVTLHPLEEGAEVIAIALRLGRQSAYDAAYVALAQSLDAELWTLDGPLARNARGVGLPVRLLGAADG
jgi:predicted nucleic acid-binding protein